MKRRSQSDPFLFIGHGFGTSARCLELYLWFVEAPKPRDQRWIAEQLPPPVASFVRFDGTLVHAGSDDDLEARVTATYCPPDEDTKPGAREWKAFCADFEDSVRRIHERSALFAVVKPDDGTYGKSLSAWHRRSLARAEELVELASARASGKNSAWSALAMNLREDIAAVAMPALPSAKQRTPNISATQQRAQANGKQLLRAALQEIVIPRLRENGFEGSLTTLRKIDKRTHT